MILSLVLLFLFFNYTLNLFETYVGEFFLVFEWLEGWEADISLELGTLCSWTIVCTQTELEENYLELLWRKRFGIY